MALGYVVIGLVAVMVVTAANVMLQALTAGI